LIDAKFPVENPARIAQMAESIKTVMQTCTDGKLLEKGADVMGKLVRAGGNLTAEVVNSEVKDALEQLVKQSHQSSEHRKLAACHMLRTLAGLSRACCRLLWAHNECNRGVCDTTTWLWLIAENAPSVFNVHVLQFMERIWNALRDSRMTVREVAVRALRACLQLVEKRETRYRVQWWYRLFDQTMLGLERPLNFKPYEMEVYIHASLLALGELLEHSGEFMLARWAQPSSSEQLLLHLVSHVHIYEPCDGSTGHTQVPFPDALLACTCSLRLRLTSLSLYTGTSKQQTQCCACGTRSTAMSRFRSCS
jgi:serine/threonine-protein kinase mTOR